MKKKYNIDSVPNRARLFDLDDETRLTRKQLNERYRNSRLVEQPGHMTGMSSLVASISTGFGWQAQNNLTGSAYSPIQNSGNINKKAAAGTKNANNTSLGCDEVISFQQGIVAGGSATVNMQALTNLLGQANVTLARFKGWQTRLLSASDDPTISPAPNTTSSIHITNNGPATPNALDFGAGSGLALNTTVAAGALNTATIMTAGSGYPPTSSFIVALNQAGASGGVIAVTTNAAGIPTGVSVVAAGAGYTNTSNVPTTKLGGFTLNTGDAHMRIDLTAAGVVIDANHCNFKIYNNDGVNAVTFELDLLGAST